MISVENYCPLYKEKYQKAIVPFLMEKYRIDNINSVPKLEKIVVSTAFGKHLSDSSKIESIFRDLMIISGQRPVYCLAKKSVAAFKVRSGMRVGCKVTLRKKRMYEFIDRLLVAFPRVKDFRGFSTRSFDGSGGYSFGIKEQAVFPEIDYDDIDVFWGMNVSIYSTAKKGQEDVLKDILLMMDFPFLDV